MPLLVRAAASTPAVRKQAIQRHMSLSAAEAGDASGDVLLEASDVDYPTPVSFPLHEHVVEIAINLGLGDSAASTIGGDLTHEYVSINADYRS